MSFSFPMIERVCLVRTAKKYDPEYVTALTRQIAEVSNAQVITLSDQADTPGLAPALFCVYGCAVMGIAAIRNGNTESHRIWMIRFVGSMWGSFWLFRVMLFVLGPLLRDFESAALLICTGSPHRSAFSSRRSFAGA
jgi:hypothetical protein